MLFTSSPAVGHLLPLLPLARAARARGHDVRIAIGSGLAPVVARAGFDHVQAGPATLLEVAQAIPALARLTGRRRAVVMVREGFVGLIARRMADDLLAALGRPDAWRPELIVREDMEVGSWLVAERLGLAHATVQVTAWRPTVRELMTASAEPLRVTHGLAVGAAERILGDLFLTTRPRSLRDAAAPLPEPNAELRPIADDLDAGAPADAPGAEPDLPPRDGRPRIAVTLGTVNAGRHDVLRAIVDGAAGIGAQVIVALGDDPAGFGPVPANVTVRRYLPMSTLLPEVDVVAFHGGSGTLTTALAAARPLVIVPIAADQVDNADQAEAAGVARTVQVRELDPATAGAAIATVLADPTFARRAAEVAAEISAMPGPDVAVERLEHLVAERHA